LILGDRQTGTELGLALVRSIVQLHHGRIDPSTNSVTPRRLKNSNPATDNFMIDLLFSFFVERVQVSGFYTKL
jgi:signal transduction histidine kinase